MVEDFRLIENYITNVDEILDLVEKNIDNFSSRGEGAKEEFVNRRYGPSNLKTLFHFNMSKDLQEAIFKTIDKQYLEFMPDTYCINMYEPGSWLSRHVDASGGYWKFNLVFLRTDKPHLKIYNEKYPDGKLIEEKPGALFEMPISLEHEVTLIEPDERPKISLVMTWDL
jgi:hypothetical protein